MACLYADCEMATISAGYEMDIILAECYQAEISACVAA
jgi:hypothetical protein